MAAHADGDGQPCPESDCTVHAMEKIYGEIDDDMQQLLQSVFSATGRGRRRSLPAEMQITNRLLLQVYCVKERNSLSWEKITGELQRLFPDYDSSSFRHLIEKTCKRICLCSVPEERQSIYSEVACLPRKFIGEFATQAGLFRENLEEFVGLSNMESISNGLLLDIFDFCQKESTITHMLEIMKIITPNLFTSQQELRRKCVTLKNKIKKLKKNSSKTVIEEFKAEMFDMGQKVNKATTSTGCDPPKKQETPNPKKILKDLQEIQEQNTSLHTKLEAVKQVCKDQQNTISSQSSQIVQLSKLEKIKQSRMSQLEKTNEQLNKKIKAIQVELRDLKSGASYQRMRRKLKSVMSTQQEIAKKESKITKVKQLQNKINYQRATGSLKTNAIKGYVKTITELRGKLAQQQKELNTSEDKVKELERTLTELQMNGTFVTRKDKHQFTDSVEKCIMELAGELDVSSQKCGQVIRAVGKLFGKNISLKELPSSSTVINMVDRAQVLSKYQIAETMSASDAWNLHSDGTTRDHKKLLGQQIVTDKGKVLSVGFSRVATENSATLLDTAIAMLHELSDIYVNDSCAKDEQFKILLSKLFATMSDRCSVNKAFNQQLNNYCKETLGSEADLKFLFCNAHFLLGLSLSSENTFKAIQEEWGHKIGRDTDSRFSRFRSTNESAGGRFVRTACDVLGPRGDEKNGCKEDWVAFLADIGKKSHVTSFRMNRFNNFFQGAAGLYFHKEDIKFFLNNYKGSLNLKLQSVLLGCQCVKVQSFVKALGLVYYFVTGPFWNMLESDLNYVEQFRYIQSMLKCFREWESDASPLFSADCEGIFKYVGEQFCTFRVSSGQVFDSLCATKSDTEYTQPILQKLMSSFIAVTERQLADFLPGGTYGEEQSDEVKQKMKHCHLTNLLSENEFGDLDFSQYRCRSASIHFHSGIQMIKKNKTLSEWLFSKSANEQVELLKLARKRSKQLRESHMVAEKKVMADIQKRLEENHRKKMEKEAKQIAAKKKIMAAVAEHGGPFCQPCDVDEAMGNCESENQKLSILKDEIRYLKHVLGIKNSRLLFGKKSASELSCDLKVVLQVSDMGQLESTSDLDDRESGSVLEQVENSDSDYEIENNSLPKKRVGDNSIEKQAKSTKRKCLDEDPIPPQKGIGFKFEHQGCWVAVAYNDRYYIGEVVNVSSPSLATVQFLNQGFKNIFRWPSVDDIADVESKYVVAHEFEVLPKSQGRTWIVPELDDIQELYISYREQYF